MPAASQDPKDFQDNAKVILDNSWLKVANSKNYHHFFPKAYLKRANIFNENSLMNITFVSDYLNKIKIRQSAPSIYIKEFAEGNERIRQTLASHFMGFDGFGIESDDYNVFLKKRADKVFGELQTRLDLTKADDKNEEICTIVSNVEN